MSLWKTMPIKSCERVTPPATSHWAVCQSRSSASCAVAVGMSLSISLADQKIGQ